MSHHSVAMDGGPTPAGTPDCGTPPLPTPHGHFGALLDHEVPNPFVNEYKWTPCNILKAVLCGLTLTWIRVLVLLLLVLFILLFAPLANLMACVTKADPEKRLPCAVRAMLTPIRWALRGVLWCFGFWWIPVKDLRADKKKKAKIIVGNHTTLMDVFWMMYWFMPSAVAKASVAKYPIIGNLCRLLGVIFVHRDDPDSRHKTAEAIMVRTKCEGARPLLIFPEGTCTNGTCLIMFKVGAFRPGVPVQPVVMQYPYKHFNPSNCGKYGSNPLWLMLQFYNRMKITLLEEYAPSAEEIGDPKKYAEGVRQAFSSAMGVPTTRHSYDDVFLAALARQSGIEQNFEVEAVESLTGFEVKDLQEIMKHFNTFASHTEGPHHSPVLDFDDFCRALSFGDAERHKAQSLFTFFDYNESGRISFLEVVTGLALLSSQAPLDEGDRMALAFRIYDVEGVGHVKARDIMAQAERWGTVADGLERDVQAQQDADGGFTFEAFQRLLARRPELLEPPLQAARNRLSAIVGQDHVPK